MTPEEARAHWLRHGHKYYVDMDGDDSCVRQTRDDKMVVGWKHNQWSAMYLMVDRLNKGLLRDPKDFDWALYG